MTLQPGTTFGGFRIEEPLGRGGMASVYRAYEAGLDRYVAVKVLPAEFLHDPTFAERFNREARVVARLEHPNIIPIYNFGIDELGRIPWMSMRLIGGGALSSLIRRTRLPYERSLRILHGVAEALDYAHTKGVVHRDVKPQNILLDESERVYLADFGIAKMVEAAGGLTQTGMISGTPQYMAPEQATGLHIDQRADVYAVGIVAYEMFTGRVPFTADTPVAVLMKQVSEPLPRPAANEVPEALVEAILRCTAKRPEERWPTTLAFVQALQAGLLDFQTPQVSAPAWPSGDVAAGSAEGLPALPDAPVDEAFDAGRTESETRAAATPTWRGPRTVDARRPTHVPRSTAPAQAAYDEPATQAATPPRSGVSTPLIVAGVLGLGLLVVLAAGLWMVWRWSSGSGQADAPPVAVRPQPTDQPQTAQASAAPTPMSSPVVSAPREASAPTPNPRVPQEGSPAPATTPRPPVFTPPPAPTPSVPPASTGPSADTRAQLERLRQGRKDERVDALLELGDRREDAAYVVPALAEALRDSSEDVRLRAAEALGKFGSAGVPAQAALVAALDGPDMVATEAAKSLGKLGPGARDAPLALGRVLQRSDVYLRREAAKALIRFGPGASTALRALTEALTGDKDKIVRLSAAQALGAIGSAAQEAVPALRRALDDKDSLVAAKAREALQRITGSEG